MKSLNRVLTYLIMILVILSVSCGKDKKSPTGPSDTESETVITENTKVVDEEENLTLDTISEETITYTFTGQTPEISKDDVLVSGEGNGYLRKVKSVNVEAEKITVQTEQAVLTDIVEQGEIDTTFTLDFGTDKAALKTAKGVSITEYGYSLKDFKIVDEQGFSVTVTDGSINFKPSIDIGMDIEDFKVIEFHTIARGDLEFDFDVSISPANKSQFKYEQSIFGYYPPRQVLVQWIGFVPVVEVITFDVITGIEINGNSEGGITTGFDQNTHVEVGAKYMSGAWSPVWEKEVIINGHDSDWGGEAEVQAKAYVRPVLSVDFYAIAGPYIDLIPYLGFDGEVGGQYLWYYEITGGVTSNLGFDVSVLGYGIANYSTELTDWETVILSDYEDLPSTYTLTGKILEDGSGLSGVTVSIKGTDVDETTTTDSNGNYTLTGLYAGTYEITLSKTGYTFTQASVIVIIADKDETVQEITATEAGGGEPHDITFITIPSGSFLMGSDFEDDPKNPTKGWGIEENERPIHTVTISSFEMSIYEITQGHYESLIGSNPSFFRRSDDLPVEKVNWYDAVKFCNKLSEQEGFEKCYNEITWECDFSKNGFRLPTEAEWEYACRAGTDTYFYTGNALSNQGKTSTDLDRAGWYDGYIYGNSEGKTHPVGQKEYNAFGLYDMHGNVSEWCNDWYNFDYYSSSPSTNPTGPASGDSRVLRGGHWGCDAMSCRSAHRSSYLMSFRGNGFGFRVVRRP